MTMISAIASSSRCSAPCKPSHTSTSSPSHQKVSSNVGKRKKSLTLEDDRRHSLEVDAGNRIDFDSAKHISEKDREVFLSYGLFNIVAGKRTAELLEKQHRHEHEEQHKRETIAARRSSEPEILRHTVKHELLTVPHTNDHTTSDIHKSSEAKGGSSEKRSLKRVAKTTSRNLQEFFKRL